ncbi:GNAT family N-acetyltransferase [Amycolatopsis rhizosphaerae]|nr:GNAT family protein [Amycolatopsis rhizosphaerae]
MTSTGGAGDTLGVISDPRPADTPWPVMSWPPAPELRLHDGLVELTQLDPERDTEALFAVLDHDPVWRHLAARPDSAADYAKSFEQARQAGRVPWLVRLLEPCAGLPAGSVVGTSSYLDVSPHDARLEVGGTAYTPAVWGTAVNPSVKLLLLTHAFEVFGAGRVQLKTDVRNVRSQRAIARLGARREGTLRRYQRRADGSVRDTVLFSITAEDWPTVRAALRDRIG